MSSHDFGYIGTGKKFDNNDNDVAQANEVVEVNAGRVFYNSTDQFGDYRIGDLFYVDQDTGAVTFTGGTFDVSSLSGINLLTVLTLLSLIQDKLQQVILYYQEILFQLQQVI